MAASSSRWRTTGRLLYLPVDLRFFCVGILPCAFKATLSQVRLKEYGSELIEVADNGPGIAPSDYQNVTLKHHTSKLARFTDLEVCRRHVCGFFSFKTSRHRARRLPKREAEAPHLRAGALHRFGVVSARRYVRKSVWFFELFRPPSITPGGYQIVKLEHHTPPSWRASLASR